MIEAKLTANHFELELHVDGYEFPDFDTGPRQRTDMRDRAHLTRRLDLHPHSPLILYTFELADFVDQLRALEHAPDDQATLGDPANHHATSSG